MKKQKSDLISNNEFTKINVARKKKHYALPNEMIGEDENSDSFIETLIGMEYDIESEEEIDDYFDEQTDNESLDENFKENNNKSLSNKKFRKQSQDV